MDGKEERQSDRMKQILVIYDDRIKPNREIAEINGGKTFGSTIYKRKTLFELMQETIPGMKLFKEGEFPDLKYCSENTVICHLFSNYSIKNQKEIEVLLEKLSYVKENYVVLCENEPAFAIFPGPSEYEAFLKAGDTDSKALKFRMKQLSVIQTDAFFDLNDQSAFLNFITGGFEARFFNALEGDYFTVRKKSSNKKKIKAEYNFYYLLPDDMKMWFVMPFHYEENEKEASYEMERYHMTDIAIRYVHGAIDEEEFRRILDQLFRFVTIRQKREITKEKYEDHQNRLYLNKLEQRMEELKRHTDFSKIEQLIIAGTDYSGIDAIIEKYKKLYHDITNNNQKKYYEVIGHGDLCFSNILYQKDAGILRLIDPKGAVSEEDMYTDPYYDLAKLSHSICGNYDFFNSGLFELKLNENMQFDLRVDSNNEKYKEIFREYLENNGFDFRRVRLYEASLFLSMLPLHMDREQKVFGFILNAVSILNTLER